MIGYVCSVDKKVTSINNNKYFDIDLKTSPMCKSKVRIMSDQQHSRDLFLEFVDKIVANVNTDMFRKIFSNEKWC